MKYRSRLALAFVLCAVVPLLVVGLLVQRETNRRIAAQHDANVESLASVIVDAFGREDARVADALRGIRGVMSADNRLRAALLGGSPDSMFVIDYAGEAMARAGLDAFQVQDSSGRILSSGHFRNDFGRVDAGLTRFANGVSEGRIALAALTTANEPMVVLVGSDTMRVADQVFMLSGGTRFDRTFLASLAPVGEMSVDVDGLPDGLLDPDPRAVGGATTGYSLPVAFYDEPSGQATTVDVRILHDATPFEALVADARRWFLITVGLAGLGALLVALVVASRMSRPIVELAEATERIDLNRLDVSFRSTRRDEVGLLSRRLGQMTRRLRQSADEIREAERRATLGEVARQVNHDVKNGLTPIRNVLRHLTKVLASDPQSLPRIYAEREQTLAASIEYLDELAANYAKLSPPANRQRCDVGAIVEQVASGHETSIRVETTVEPGAEVAADPVSMRRIVENLFRNALQSMDGDGQVTLAVSRVDGDSSGDSRGDGAIRLMVADTGRGMSAETKARIFDDFFTTRAAGTGLGLSIVRRLVMDLGGSISVESEEGHGSTFTVDFPPYQNT